MSNTTLTASQESIIHNCLLDLRDSFAWEIKSFLPLALDSLLNSEGFGIEMSGIYVSIDEDQLNIPDYLQDGMAFEFVNEHVILPLNHGAKLIDDWCKKNAIDDREEILLKCQRLKEQYGA